MTDWGSALVREEPKPAERKPPVHTRSVVTDGSRETKYLQAVLDREAEKVRKALDGTRNDTLNRAAFCCAQFEGIPDTLIEKVLCEAGQSCGLGDREITQTVASGIAGGRKEPREIPAPASTGGSMPGARGIGGTSQPGGPAHTGVPSDDWSPTDSDAPNAPPPGEVERELRTVASLSSDVLSLVQRRANGDEKQVPVPFADYSVATNGGLWSGNETIVGLTGSLKSQFVAQKIMHAAKAGVPCLLVTLELTPVQSTLRLLCDHAEVSWSKCENGKASDQDQARLKATKAEFDKLPIVVKYGTPQEFTTAKLDKTVQRFRKQHPTGPLYAVVDFAQLMGTESQSVDVRERVGSVFYGMQGVARRNDVAMTAVSSTARMNYALLSDVEQVARLDVVQGERVVGNPSAVLAAAKESGEAEYSCDSLWVMCKWPTRLDNGDSVIICVQGKHRFGPCTWFALAASQGRLHGFQVNSMADLPAVERDRGGKPAVSQDVFEERVLECVRTNPGLVKSKTGFRAHVSGTAAKVDAAATRLIDTKQIVKDDGGFRLFDPIEQGTIDDA